MTRSPRLIASIVLLTAVTGCGEGPSTTTERSDSSSTSSGSGAGAPGGEDTENADYPNVIEASLSNDGGVYSLSVTMSSQYDTPERYADGWRVLDPEGNELGENTLGHDHASEQPFTRSQSGLEIPEGVEKVTIEGRDLENGYGGETVTLDVPS